MRLVAARLLLLLAALAAAPASAYGTLAGAFVLPEGIAEYERTETPDGQGLYVFGPADARGVVLMLVVGPAGDPAEPFDAREAASMICNPYDPESPRDAIGEGAIGGVAAARAEDRLPDGQRSVALVLEHGGRRLVVLMKGPDTPPTDQAITGFEAALAGFSWRSPAG